MKVKKCNQANSTDSNRFPTLSCMFWGPRIFISREPWTEQKTPDKDRKICKLVAKSEEEQEIYGGKSIYRYASRPAQAGMPAARKEMQGPRSGLRTPVLLVLVRDIASRVPCSYGVPQDQSSVIFFYTPSHLSSLGRSNGKA